MSKDEAVEQWWTYYTHAQGTSLSRPKKVFIQESIDSVVWILFILGLIHLLLSLWTDIFHNIDSGVSYIHHHGSKFEVSDLKGRHNIYQL